MRTSLRIGGGAGFAGDRLDAPLDLAERGELDYLVLECLAERTIALAQLRRRRDPASGYDARLRGAHRVAAADPRSARESSSSATSAPRIRSPRQTRSSTSRAACASRSRSPPSRATTCSTRSISTTPTMESGAPLSTYAPIVSANAYLGAEALLPALASGADIVVTGRVADPSLFVAPLMHEYGWALGRRRPSRARHRGGSSARMRGPAVRRLLRRSRAQGNSRTWRISAFRSRTSTPTATRCSARSPAPAGASRAPPRPSSSSTKSPIRTATSRRT